MAITKPPVLPAWAESGDRVTPSNAEIQVGWPLSSIPPSRQRFNWLLNYLANAVRYFSRRGIPDYDAAETYMIGDRIIGDDGKTYRSLIDTNLAQTPSTSPTKWEEWAPTLARFAALIQGQTYTAFTTAGAAPNFTLTPSPAIAAYAAGQRFRVKFHAVGAGADQLNVSALGNKALKQYDSTGAKVAAVVAVSQLVDVEYDGVDMVLLDPLPPPSSVKGSQTFTTSGTFTVPASVTEVVVEVWGGGGSGAGSGTGGNGNGGGAAGGFALKRVTGLTPGGTVAVTVGAGGAKQSAAGTAGNTGSTSSFGAYCSATGGAGGKVGLTDAATSHAVGGTGTGGDVNIQGGYGHALPNSLIGGDGGSAPRGGQGGACGIATTATVSDGRDGGLPGGGGGGADDAGSAGGAGAAGMVYVRWGI